MKVAFRKKVLLSDKTTGRFLKITAEICNYKFRVYIGVISKVNLFNYTEMGNLGVNNKYYYCSY